MHYARFLIVIIAATAALAMGVRFGAETAAAKDWPPDPCKGKPPACARGSTAVCVHRTICGCVRWTCAVRALKPPMVKPSLNPPKPLPGSQLR